jgi:putative protein kinase ArgK-like GTPase of G3E family
LILRFVATIGNGKRLGATGVTGLAKCNLIEHILQV